MNPECPKCRATSVRRVPRDKSLGHKFMYFFGLFPWECLTCQERFFSATRHSRSKRHPLGEIYTESNPAPAVKAGAQPAVQSNSDKNPQ